ncbi:MAG: cytochrome c family protein [Alphaproteobacteria bacterium]|nr:cytochrome c family protein [Alphaproteobacteria bacterium]
MVRLVLIAAALAALGFGRSPVLAASAANGEKVFKQCVSCHTVKAGGANRVGPNLHGLLGRPAGSRPNFSYSKAMKESGVVWTEGALSTYLQKPSDFIKGNKMTFVGIRKDDDRADLIAFLKEATK